MEIMPLTKNQVIADLNDAIEEYKGYVELVKSLNNAIGTSKIKIYEDYPTRNVKELTIFIPRKYLVSILEEQLKDLQRELKERLEDE